MSINEWQLRDRNNKIVNPYIYTNGKSQKDVVKELIKAVDNTINDKDNPIILIGTCNSGKSAIALNVINHYNKGIIVTPTISLEKQYEASYCDGKYNIGKTSNLLDVRHIKGRKNFNCLHVENIDCSNGMLPCIKKPPKGITRAEYTSLQCSYWSPVYNMYHSGIIGKYLLGYKQYIYNSVNGLKCFFKSKNICPYYEQYIHYIKDRVALIYNYRKWEIETWNGMKPNVDVEIIDEGDEVLDGLCYKLNINMTMFDKLEKDGLPVKLLNPLREKLLEILHSYTIDSINIFINELRLQLMDNIEGSNTGQDILSKLELQDKYGDEFECVVQDKSLILYIPRPDIVLKELMKRSGKIILMSATMQSINILKHLYGIDPIIVYAEKEFVGKLNIIKNGKEKDINYRSWESIKNDCWRNLYNIIDIAPEPILISVHSLTYLPDELRKLNRKDLCVFHGKKIIVATDLDRGIDLPDDRCRSVIILKYPLPTISDPVIQAIKSKLGAGFNLYYKDLADRNLVQQVSRGVRHKDDWCNFYTLDINALNSLLRSGWNKRNDK